MANRRGGSIVAVVAGLLLLGAAVPIFLLSSGSGDDSTPAERETEEITSDSGGDGSDVLEVVGIVGFIVVSMVGSLFLAGMLLRKMSRSHVIEQGVAATGLITSMAETGTTVNNNPMVEFGLRIRREGAGEYDATVKQVLPRLLLARVQPGLVVPVKVLEAEPSEVAIDFDALSEAGIGAPTLSASALADAPVRETVDTDEFLVRAIPADAEIDEMAQADRTATNPRSGEEFEVFTFVLTVHRDGHPPYTANLLQGVPAEHIGTIGPGGRVPIGIHPDNPSDVAINWRELERQRRTGRS